MDKAEIYALCDNQKPILIAGATASGKSSLAIDLAKKFNGVVVNADALQVYQSWSILTARPPKEDLVQAPHCLYGHIPLLSDYSSGHWVREIKELIPALKAEKLRPIIVGGTGLYFKALTDGLANIPEISDETRLAANRLQAQNGSGVFAQMLNEEVPEALNHLDRSNPKRTMRAWEVWHETGKPLHEWHKEMPPPPLPLKDTVPLLLTHEVDWLNARIEKRFDLMLQSGAIEECHDVLDNHLWDKSHPSCKAIGAYEIVQHIKGNMTLDDARTSATAQTRRYAKRQRTWARSKMASWHKIPAESL